MQYWPRKRAGRPTARIRNFPANTGPTLGGFAAYKVGMTQILAMDNKPTSLSKGQQVSVPVTILECPPITIIAVKLYTRSPYGVKCVGQITSDKQSKELARRIPIAKKQPTNPPMQKIDEVRILAHTQPKLTTIGKKTPEMLEFSVGGKTPEEKLTNAKNLLGKDITIQDVFKEGQFVDVTSVTKGKGVQGPIKRFGIMLRAHKSEKTKSGPGSLGPWHGPRTYRVAHAGQTGYQQRTEHNKQIINISTTPEKINPTSGFVRYGLIKNNYILLKGSIGGAAKRLITLTHPRRITPKPEQLTIQKVNLR